MQPGIVDDLREPLFDTYSAAKNAVLPTSIKLFTKGQSDTKGPEKTNLTNDGELPAPERMSVYGIRIEFLNTADADILGILQNYAARLVVSGKPKCTAPIEFFAAGAGINGKSQNGVPDARATFQMPEGFQIDIEAGNRFYFELVSSTGYTLTDAALGLFARVYLDGVHTVPVV